MNVLVETAEGIASMCGDVIYDINDQLVAQYHQVGERDPALTGNHGTTKRAEKGGVKKLLNQSRFILPAHDRPAAVEHGQVIGRLHDAIPGPIIDALPRRAWAPF